MTAPSTKTEVMLLVEAIRREQPRNVKVMQAMDLLERATILLTQKSNALNRPKFNRRDYMRGYMKEWRAGKRGRNADLDPMDQPIA